jgi:hypothetical protein
VLASTLSMLFPALAASTNSARGPEISEDKRVGSQLLIVASSVLTTLLTVTGAKAAKPRPVRPVHPTVSPGTPFDVDGDSKTDFEVASRYNRVSLL